jgi:hypothetical protein
LHAQPHAASELNRPDASIRTLPAPRLPCQSCTRGTWRRNCIHGQDT